MKKLLLTSIALAVAAPSFATTVYQNGDVSLDIYGRFGAAFDKSEQTKADLKDDESRIGAKVTYDLNGGYKALGGVEFRFADSEGRFSNPTTHDAYAGLAKDDLGTITLGRQATTADELRLSDYQYRRGNMTLLPTHGDRTVKIRSVDFGNEYGLGSVSFGADYTFMGSADKNEAVKSRSIGGGIFYTKALPADMQLKVNGGYAQTTYNDATINNSATTTISSGKYRLTDKAHMIGVELKVNQDLSFGVDYSHAELRAKEIASAQKSSTLKRDAFQVAGKYALTSNNNLFSSYGYTKAKEADVLNVSTHRYTIGLDHKLHKNVVTYAQLDFIKSKDNIAKESSNDLGGAVGLRVLF